MSGLKRRMKKFRDIARFLKGSTHFLLLALAAGMLTTMFNALTPQIIRYTVDRLTSEAWQGGNYLLLAGDYESKDIVGLMTEMFEFIRDYEGEIPGASPKDCGNYLDMNLGMAKYLADRYLKNVLYDIKPDRLVYPE